MMAGHEVTPLTELNIAGVNDVFIDGTYSKNYFSLA